MTRAFSDVFVHRSRLIVTPDQRSDGRSGGARSLSPDCALARALGRFKIKSANEHDTLETCVGRSAFRSAQRGISLVASMTTPVQAPIARTDDTLSYVRVSILGTMVGTEVWSINPVFDPTGEFPGGVSQSALDAAAQAIANRSVPTQLLNQLSTSGQRTGARVEVRDDATDALIATSTASSATVSSGVGAIAMPSQSAMVISIRTDTPGGSGRGRLYWPCLVKGLDINGKVATVNVAAFIADAKAYLLGIRSDLAAAFPTIGFDLAVRSKTTHTTPHAVRVQAGNVIDTQRRRRDAVIEQYSTLNFP